MSIFQQNYPKNRSYNETLKQQPFCLRNGCFNNILYGNVY